LETAVDTILRPSQLNRFIERSLERESDRDHLADAAAWFLFVIIATAAAMFALSMFRG